MSIIKSQLIGNKKSRRDGILLTVDFNLRTRGAQLSPQSPAGTTLSIDNMPSLRDLLRRWASIRRLNGTALDEVKPTVNKMPSLRDFSSDKLITTFFH